MNQDNPFIPDFHAADSPVRKTTWYSKELQEVLNLAKQNRKSAKAEAYQRLAARLAVNVSKISACQLSDQQFNNFKKLAADIIDQIPEEIIDKNKTLGVTPGQKDILNLFHQEFYESRRPKVEDLAKTNLIINAINFENEELIFDCWFYHNAAIARGDCKIAAEFDGAKISYKMNHIFSKTVYFGRTVNEKFSFQFKIPTKNLHENSKLNFFLVDTRAKNDNKYQLNIKFNNSRPSARLSQKFPHSYWIYEGQKAVLRTPTSIIFKTINHKKQERKLYRDFLKYGKKSTAIKAIALRMLYHVFHRLTRNEQIWLTFDKLYKAGDNGEYFFQYCQKHPRDHIECFYILDKKSNDYARLKNNEHVLKFKSLKSRLVALNATAVFATHADAHNFLGIHKTYEEYLRDLLNYDVFCIQHGLTIQDIPNLQNRLRDNTKLYFIASPLEAKNLAKPDYNYDKSQLIPAGLARFDGLKGKTKKQILLAPTWRSSMANENTVAGSARPYFDEFKKTDYYQVFQSLLNNQQLKNAAEKYGYEIIYLLHPTLISQAKDFSTNSKNIKVKIPTGDFNYEVALKESRLMVTDYSGIQYDFAYQRKPIIYFHPDALPAHYNSSINYETQGFGPIVKTEDALVAALENAMKNDCKNPPKFQKRAEKFFYFHDQKSCARIYQSALKYIKKKGKNV